jgi:tetratricopeptide (TPR) repeat protein
MTREVPELPATKARAVAADVDLPNLRSTIPPAPLESDLPAALGARPVRTATATHDTLPPGLGMPRSSPPSLGSLEDDSDWDLPEKLDPVKQPAPPRGSQFELDLPASKSAGSPPRAAKSVDEADDFEFDLPSPVGSRQETAQGTAHVGATPSRTSTIPGGYELPDLIETGLPQVSHNSVGLPSLPGKTPYTKKTLTGTGSSAPPPAFNFDNASAASVPGELDLGLDLGFGGSTSSFPPSKSLDADFSRSSASSHAAQFDQNALGGAARTLSDAGTTDYGEVALESSEQELAVETEIGAPPRSLSGEALEFGAVPQAPDAMPGDAAAEAPAPKPAASVATLTTPQPSSRRFARGKTSRRAWLTIAGIALLSAAGGALTLLPDIGPFGAHFIADQIGKKQNNELVARQVEGGRKVLLADDYSGVERVLNELERARRDHERLRALKAYAAYFIYAVELRHGSQPQYRARAKVILDELGERTDVPFVALGGAARAGAEGNLAKARRLVQIEISRDAGNVDARVLSAELSLLERRSPEALEAWQSVAKLEPSARTAFGTARAHVALGQFEAAQADAELTLTRNPNHVGARLILARIALAKRGETEVAQRWIAEALGLQNHQSTADFVLGKTLTGDLYLLRSRISQAEASYQEALAKDPHSAPALRGLGETLYRAGRYSESLARFEAGLQADPDDVLMAVGAAKAQLALERVREAHTLLSRLRQSNPKNYAVNYWYGKAEEAAGNREEAEAAYTVAIEVGGTDSIVVDAYVSLALLKNQQGRREEAQKVLAAAQEKLPRMPKIHEALGQLALAEGRYAAAVQEFNAAAALDPTDLGIKFRLGVALRKNREFEAATKVFDDLTAADRDYPGLALERGQLYEASGQTEEALRAFESALAKAPTDPDLMLRVGCGKVAAGQAQQSEQLLKKVLEQRPTSAETHHCLGRAQLLEGTNLALALRTLERAAELDPHRAEYYLYVGWAANEAGRVAVAEQALKKALELDQGLGDAYWQRGILRYRQGAVKDAVVDLTRALELRPGRYEAHAALADAYFDLGLEPKALEQWNLATHAQPDNATWRFRYGKLLQASHHDAEARPELEAALELASKLPVMPRWAWEAHHLLARAIGMHPAAVKHWQAFLELAPLDNAYRDEAMASLAKLGQPWK